MSAHPEPSSPDDFPPGDDDFTIEPVTPGERLPDATVRLQGEAAAPILDLVTGAAKEMGKLAKQADDSRALYRVVPREELAKGLKSGSLEYANPLKGGDGSVLIKSNKTGQIAGHADLKRVVSPTKLIGPAVWQAMAMATQQHYLVEINTKLAGIEKGVQELLAQRTDEQLGQLEELRELPTVYARTSSEATRRPSPSLSATSYRSALLNTSSPARRRAQ